LNQIANPKAYVSGSATDPPDSTNSNQYTDTSHSQSHESDEKENDTESIDDLIQQSPIMIDNGPNNLVYTVLNVGFGREFISGASAYPPELDYNKPITASTDTNAKNSKYVIDIISQVYIDNGLIGDTETLIDSSDTVQICNIKPKYDVELMPRASIAENFYSINNLNSINNSQVKEIHSNLVKWWIQVPVRLTDDSIIYVKMLADTGANAGCIDTEFALKYFKEFIVHNRKNSTLNTPGGPVHPKYCVYLTFPTKSGIILKAKLYLINNLPVSIIADLNMLMAFGYQFNNQIPKPFTHEEEPPLDLQLKNEDNLYRIHHNYKSKKNGKPLEIDYVGAKKRLPNFEDYNNFKQSSLNYDPIDNIIDDNQVLYCSEKSQINNDEESKQDDLSEDKILFSPPLQKSKFG